LTRALRRPDSARVRTYTPSEWTVA